MESRIYSALVMVFLTTTCLSAEEKPSVELFTIQEAYKATRDNLVSGSGTGVYEIYSARAGKDTKMELKAKAKTKIFFDRGRFHIRLDYEKDDIRRLESSVIVYDGTAILVNKVSKLIQPSHSEGDVYEAKPTRAVMRKAGFDYNPCSLPAGILPVDKLPNYAKGITIKPDDNKDYLGTFDVPPVVRCSFLASRKVGYNVINYREYNTNHNNFQHVNLQADWEQKKGLWYVKSIDRQWLAVDGKGERRVFRYTDFEPNAEVSPSLFKFDSLDLAPTARVIDRRPNVEEPVLRQSQSSPVDMAKLDTLTDAVKALTPSSAPPQPLHLRMYYLLIAGGLLCILGLLLMRRRAKKGDTTPNS